MVGAGGACWLRLHFATVLRGSKLIAKVTGARMALAVFPGRRSVWFGVGAVLILASVMGGKILLARTDSLTGTNSVGVATVIANAGPGRETCVRDLDVPAGTGRIAVSVAALGVASGKGLRSRLITSRGQVRLQQTAPLGPISFVPLSLPRELQHDAIDATLCVTPRGMTVAFGGASVQRLPGAPVTTVAGMPLVSGDIGVRYLAAAGPAPRVVGALPSALRRANTFESGLGTVLMWLALPALVMLVYLTARVSATADVRSIRALALTTAAVSFVHATAWAVLLPPFHGADESEHFAYAQHLAATNQRAEASFGKRPPYSTSQLRLMEALHHNSTILNTTSRPRWEKQYSADYRMSTSGARDDDGGGFTTGASGHSPLYYTFIGLPYRALHDVVDLPSVLLTMRLLNALLAAAVASFAVLTAGLLFGGQRAVPWLAGLLVGLQPVFGSLAGSVNNDTAVNVAAAGFIYLLVRAWRLGPTLKDASWLGAVAIALPVAKITGFALLPVLAVAAVAIAAAHGVKPMLRWVGMLAGTAAVAALVWSFALGPALSGTRGSIVNQHPSAPSVVGAPPPGTTVSIGTRANYLLQTFVTEPTFGTEHWELRGAGSLERWPAYAIYIKRGYGLFGWKSVELSQGLSRGIFVSLLAGWALCLAGAFRHRRSHRWWLSGVTILVASVPLVLAFVSYAFTSPGPQTDFGEQGRYLFTALVPLAVLFSAACFAAEGRMRHAVIGVVTSAASCLAVIAWVSALRGWFT